MDLSSCQGSTCLSMSAQTQQPGQVRVTASRTSLTAFCQFMRARALSYGVFLRLSKRCDCLASAAPCDFLDSAAPCDFLPSIGAAIPPCSAPRIIDCRVMADMEPELLLLHRRRAVQMVHAASSVLAIKCTACCIAQLCVRQRIMAAMQQLLPYLSSPAAIDLDLSSPPPLPPWADQSPPCAERSPPCAERSSLPPK